MATEEAVPTANQVSAAFVHQYFQIIEQNPENACKLYAGSSVVTRPGPDGTMVSFKSVKAINEHFISSGYESTTFQVLSIDSQYSVKDGVFIMVVGFSTGNDMIKKKFSQMFYLAHDASQENPNSYSVFNDIFRYVAEEASTPKTLPVAESVPVTEKAKPAETKPVHKISAKAVEKSVNAAEVKKVVAAAPSLDNGTIKHSDEKAVAAAPVDGAKMSYAAMVQSMAKNAAPFQVKAASVQVQVQVQKPKPRAAAAAPKAPAAAVSKSEKRRIIDEPGTSIFVANLPMEAVPSQLYELFKDFGPIKEHGVQIRSSKASGICFGFVAFESTASVQSVLKAAKSYPFWLADRKLRVKEKLVDYDGSRQSGGRNGGGGSRAQNGSASSVNGGEEFKPVGKPSGGKSGNGNGNLTPNGSASADGEDDDFTPIRSRRRGNRNERRGDSDNNNQKSSEGVVKA